MAPAGDLAVRVQRGGQVLRADGVVVAVADLVLAAPLHLDRGADGLRQAHGLVDVVALALAAESAAAQRHVDADPVCRQPGGGGRQRDQRLRVLGRGPDLAALGGDRGDRGRRLHHHVAQVRGVVLGLQHLRGAARGGVEVALVAHRLAGLAHGLQQLLLEAFRIVVRVRTVIPLDLEQVAGLQRRPAVAGDDRHAAQRLVHDRRLGGRQFDHLLDAGHGPRLVGVERADPAQHHRRARDRGVLHAGQHDVGAVDRLAADDALQVDALQFLADVAELLRRFQRQLLRRRHRQRGRRGDQFGEVRRAAAGAVRDAVVLRAALGSRHAPLLRGGLLEHQAHAGAGLAHALVEGDDGQRTAGVLVAEFLVAGGLLDHDAGPVGLHLVGHHRGQAGLDALPHLAAVRNDAHGAVGLDRDVDVRRPRPGCDGRFRRRCGGLLGLAAAEQRHADHQHAAGLEEVAAADGAHGLEAGGRGRGRGGQRAARERGCETGIVDADHDRPPATDLMAFSMRW